MAILFQDDASMIKCECGSISFEEKQVFTYKRVKDRNGEGLEKEVVKVLLKCATCGKVYPSIADLSKIRVLLTNSFK